MAGEYTFPEDTYILLGKVMKAHGLQGDVKFFLFSGQPENLGSYREIVLVDAKGRLSPPLKIARYRSQGKLAIVKLESVSDRSFAEKIEGMGILLAKDQLPQPSRDEFYYHQYIGKKVVDENGDSLGNVVDIFSNGAHDILVVAGHNEELYIPLVQDIIRDETESELIIQPPPGLLDINRNVGDPKG